MSTLEDRVDRLTEAVFQISSDLWSTRDRLMVLEEVLANAGIDAPTLVDNHALSAALDQRLSTEREAFVHRLVEQLSGVRTA